MALSITELCTGCFACMELCPCGAITEEKPRFRIDPLLCTECDGHFSDPQCAAICPVESAILDAAGKPINPPGSLTGIPLGRLAAINSSQSASKGVVS